MLLLCKIILRKEVNIMAVVIRESEPKVVEHIHSDGGNSTGWIVGLILLLAVLFIFFYYGLPLLRSAGSVNTAPQVNVPDKVDVNINKTQ